MLRNIKRLYGLYEARRGPPTAIMDRWRRPLSTFARLLFKSQSPTLLLPSVASYPVLAVGRFSGPNRNVARRPSARGAGCPRSAERAAASIGPAAPTQCAPPDAMRRERARNRTRGVLTHVVPRQRCARSHTRITTACSRSANVDARHANLLHAPRRAAGEQTQSVNLLCVDSGIKNTLDRS